MKDVKIFGKERNKNVIIKEINQLIGAQNESLNDNECQLKVVLINMTKKIVL